MTDTTDLSQAFNEFNEQLIQLQTKFPIRAFAKALYRAPPAPSTFRSALMRHQGAEYDFPPLTFDALKERIRQKNMTLPSLAAVRPPAFPDLPGLGSESDLAALQENMRGRIDEVKSITDIVRISGVDLEAERRRAERERARQPLELELADRPAAAVFPGIDEAQVAKDEFFIDFQRLQDRMAQAAKASGVVIKDKAVVRLMAHALQERLKSAVSDMIRFSKTREDFGREHLRSQTSTNPLAWVHNVAAAERYELEEEKERERQKQLEKATVTNPAWLDPRAAKLAKKKKKQQEEAQDEENGDEDKKASDSAVQQAAMAMAGGGGTMSFDFGASPQGGDDLMTEAERVAAENAAAAKRKRDRERAARQAVARVSQAARQVEEKKRALDRKRERRKIMLIDAITFMQSDRRLSKSLLLYSTWLKFDKRLGVEMIEDGDGDGFAAQAASADASRARARGQKRKRGVLDEQTMDLT